MVDLDGLLKRLGPERLVRLQFEVDNAYKTFPLAEPKVDTFPEFQELLGRYYGHLLRGAVHHCGNVELDEEELRERGMHLVERVSEGGRVEAFNRAKSGRDGGLPIVLQKMGDAFKKATLDGWIVEALRQTIDREDWNEREALAAAYLERFRHLLSPELASASPAFLATRLEEIIAAHVQAQPLLGKLPAQR